MRLTLFVTIHIHMQANTQHLLGETVRWFGSWTLFQNSVRSLDITAISQTGSEGGGGRNPRNSNPIMSWRYLNDSLPFIFIGVRDVEVLGS